MSTLESDTVNVNQPLPDILAGQQLPAPPRQERSRRKHEALLAAALALFAEQGYEQTAIEAIAQRAGVSVGGFYQHFASKRQLLFVLMDQLLQKVAALPMTLPDLSPEQVYPVLEGLVRHGLQIDWSYAGAYRAWREASAADAEMRRQQQRLEAWTVQQLAMLFSQLQTVPGARPQVDVITLAEVVGALFWRLAENPLDEPHKIDALVTSMTHLIFHALFADAQ